MAAKHTQGLAHRDRFGSHEDPGIYVGDKHIAQLLECWCADPEHAISSEEACCNRNHLIACWNTWVGINPAAVPKLLAACEEAIGFCVNARETWPDWNDHLDVGILYSKLSTAIALAGQEPQDGQGTRQESPVTDDRPEIDPGAAE